MLAAMEGIEPSMIGSKPIALPLGYIANTLEGVEGLEPSLIGSKPTALPLG